MLVELDLVIDFEFVCGIDDVIVDCFVIGDCLVVGLGVEWEV